jgi:CTP synthase
VIDIMPDQRDVAAKGATMRLGAYPCSLVPGSKVAQIYGATEISERHRHRYEFNNDYFARFEEAGLIPSGRLTSGKLVEIVELKNHPWFLAVQFHPEFKSKLTAPHPLFRSFIEASVRRRSERAR